MQPMAKRANQPPQGYFSPAATIAAAAAAASAIAAFASFVLWSLLPGVLLPAALVLLAPALVGLVALAAARRAIRAALDPAAVSLDRLAAQDFSVDTALPCGPETAALAQALERCRAALSLRRRSAKLHEAVARLADAAMGRLAEGDLSVRIGVELPPPYDRLRDAFNNTATRLESSGARHDAPAGRLRRHAQEIGTAAAQLARRAGKLAERIEAEIDAHGRPEEGAEMALQRLLHMMEGVRVATQRNAQAAERFADLGRLVAREAQLLARPEDDLAPTPDDEMQTLPEAALPASTGAAALQRHG